MRKKSTHKDLIRRFIGNMRKKGYIEKRDRILIACSGGVDSTVLLDLLYRIKDKYVLKLKIIHFNHCLRGRESDGDERFVEEFAKRYNLEVITEKGEVRESLAGKRYSIEEKARILRYDFFERVLKKEGFDKIATGHNADDQAETIIMNFIKGYSLESLKGIKEVRDNYIRPLIIFTRDEIDNYATFRNIDYVVDSTNIEIKYVRNRIRHKLLPLLKSE
ncbi:tRNA lysidine(34) synthetase TilS, partial [candidate division KSB1 bacterium]